MGFTVLGCRLRMLYFARFSVVTFMNFFSPCHGRASRLILRLAKAVLLFLLAISCFAAATRGQQAPEQKPKQPAQGMGVATGVAHAAVKDSHSRPITAGGFVDDAPVVFADITKQAGLDKFLHRREPRQKNDSGDHRFRRGIARL